MGAIPSNSRSGGGEALQAAGYVTSQSTATRAATSGSAAAWT